MTVARHWTPPAVRAKWRRSRGVLAAVLLVVSTGACAGGSGVPPTPPTPDGSSESRFQLALDHVQRDEFGEAARELAELAATCESGLWGRNAFLILASLELNPRNESGSPASGARLAARYLQLPSVPAASVAAAETLYLLAVDLGAEPVVDPFGASPESVETALAFENCESIQEPVLVREIPRHPGPPTTRAALVGASAQRDSLAALVDSLALRTVELEAELERIRRLLVPDSIGGGGGSRTPGP